jgi:hypothetical protein
VRELGLLVGLFPFDYGCSFVVAWFDVLSDMLGFRISMVVLVSEVEWLVFERALDGWRAMIWVGKVDVLYCGAVGCVFDVWCVELEVSGSFGECFGVLVVEVLGFLLEVMWTFLGSILSGVRSVVVVDWCGMLLGVYVLLVSSIVCVLVIGYFDLKE